MASIPSIFVSHAHSDSAWCQDFVSDLRRRGADIWYDEHNLGAGMLRDAIERELQRCSVFIVVLSPDAVASQWVRREMLAAMVLHDRDESLILLPVVAKTCDVPIMWSVYQRISGPNGSGLSPHAAASQVGKYLGLSISMSQDSAAQIANDTTAEGAWKRGEALRGQNHLKDALTAYDHALSLDPSFVRAWTSKGDVLQRMKRYTEAFAAYDAALSVDANVTAAVIGKGEVLRKLGYQQQPLTENDRQAFAAVERSPDPDVQSALAWYGKGSAFGASGRWDEALAAYDRSLAIEDTFAPSWSAKGSILEKLRDFDNAFDAYNRALELDPRLASAWIGKGSVLEALNRFDEAIGAYEEALRLDPHSAAAWQGKGNALQRAGKRGSSFVASGRSR